MHLLDQTVDEALIQQPKPPLPLKIAIVTETWPPDVNGVAITLSRMTRGLVAFGHRVDLIRPYDLEPATSSSDIEGIAQMFVRGLPIPGYRTFQMGMPAFRHLKSRWQTHRPDVVHIATEGPLGWSALRAGRALGIAVSSDYRTNFGAYARHYRMGALACFVEAYLRRFHNRAQATAVPTSALADQLSRLGFEKLHVIGRGIDCERFSPVLRDPKLRKSWGADDEDVVLAYVGRLAAEKNLDLLVQTYRSVASKLPRTRLLVVGDGPQREALMRSVPSATMVGAQNGDSLARHYASADAFLFPSLTETYGNVVPEAMASGLPVLAFDCAAAAELIEHGISGLLAPVGSPKVFIELASLLASDRVLRKSLSHAARQVAIRNTWDQIIRRFSDLLAETAAQTQPRNSAHEIRG
jgi:glycosyltransferase involved in cell wall biosynthesis